VNETPHPARLGRGLHHETHQAHTQTDHPQTGTVTARKDDAPAATQAAITNVAGVMSFSEGGELIQTTSG